MTTLTLIAEPFPDWEARQHTAAAQDLTIAVAETAPRACSARHLVARGSRTPDFSSPKVRTEHLPVSAKALPVLWRSGSAARPLDGEFVHATTPFAPLRGRGEDDGSQTSVMVPHALAWEAPELLGKGQARLYRSFVRRAAKYADVILTPTHATAVVLQQHFGDDLPVQVFQLATPTVFAPHANHAARRAELYLPERYAVTTAPVGPHGRREWIYDALRADTSLPPVVVIEELDPILKIENGQSAAPELVPEDLHGRIISITPDDLSDVGAVLGGATLMLQPQSYTGTGYTILGALSAHVPVLHAGHPATSEIVYDAGIIAADAAAFSLELSRAFREPDALNCVTVMARDRSRSFSWESAGWQLWETHANL